MPITQAMLQDSTIPLLVSVKVHKLVLSIYTQVVLDQMETYTFICSPISICIYTPIGENPYIYIAAACMFLRPSPFALTMFLIPFPLLNSAFA